MLLRPECQVYRPPRTLKSEDHWSIFEPRLYRSWRARSIQSFGRGTYSKQHNMNLPFGMPLLLWDLCMSISKEPRTYTPLILISDCNSMARRLNALLKGLRLLLASQRM